MELILVIFGSAALAAISGAFYGHRKSGNGFLSKQFNLLMSAHSVRGHHHHRLQGLGFTVSERLNRKLGLKEHLNPPLLRAGAERLVQTAAGANLCCRECDGWTFDLHLADMNTLSGKVEMVCVGTFCDNPACGWAIHGQEIKNFLAERIREHGNLIKAIRALEEAVVNTRNAEEALKQLEPDYAAIEHRINARQNLSVYGRLATDAAPAQDDDLAIDVLEAERVLIHETIRGWREVLKKHEQAAEGLPDFLRRPLDLPPRFR